MLALLADLLTLSRIGAAGVLVWLGITAGAASLPAAALVTVLGWTTDQLDGWVARLSPARTRLGVYDFPIDVIFYAGIVVYLVLSGFVPVMAAAGFMALSFAAWLASRRKAVAILALRVVDLTCAVVIFRNAAWIGYLLLVWLVLLGWIYRRRLVERVPRWFDDLRQMVSRRQGA